MLKPMLLLLLLIIVVCPGLVRGAIAGDVALSPTALHVVLVGFHRQSKGYVSDYDLEKVLGPDVASSTWSLGEGPYKRLMKFIETTAPSVPSGAFTCELMSLAASLGLLEAGGFTLFVLNFETTNNKTAHSYCHSRFVDDACSKTVLNMVASPDDRGDAWSTRDSLYVGDARCNNADDACQVNSWISDDRIGWIDLSARRTQWGAENGLRLPPPPSHVFSLDEQREYAKRVKHLALTEPNCKNCRSFLQAWTSLLDRAAQETDFSRAYDTVGRAANELESVISRDFAVSEGSVKSGTVEIVSRKSSDFLARLALVIKSFSTRVLLPFNAEVIHAASLHGFGEDEESLTVAELPSKITVHLYLVRGHDDDTDLGPSEADLELMRKDLERLAAPTVQSFAMVVHKIDLDSDHVLASAFAFATRTMVIPRSGVGENELNQERSEVRTYLDSKELRQCLLSEHQRAHLENSRNSLSTKRSADHVDIPVFWFFGVDSSAEPLFVDGFHRAVHHGDIAVVVESKHASIERINAWCGGKRVAVSAAKPLRAATIATAHLWWTENLGGSIVAEQYLEKTSAEDWSWATGVGDARGLSIFEDRDEIGVGRSLLSNTLVDAFHRSTILEMFRKLKPLEDRLKKKTKRKHEITTALNEIKLRKGFTAVNARRGQWDLAFSNLSLAVTLTKELSLKEDTGYSKAGASRKRCEKPASTAKFNVEGVIGYLASLF